MIVYKEFYYHLFNAITDVIEDQNIHDAEEIKKQLISVQLEAEERYIEMEEDDIRESILAEDEEEEKKEK